MTYSYEIGDESALVGADYTASPASGTIVIPPLTYEANIVIPTVNDSNVESPEYFHILLTNGINTSTTSVSVYPYIYDDDTSTVYARWKSPNLSYDEGDGSVTVEAVLNKTASSNVQIPFTVSGTAANPDKHDLVGGTITIPTGQLSASVSFNLVDDAIPGLAKTVVLTKGTVVNATWAGSSTDVVNILDNDELPTLDLNLESQTVAEDVGTVVIPVQLSATAGDNVSIPYTIKNITTSRTHDHTADSGTLVITAGSMSGNINIPIVDDLRIENTESMSITLGSATGALVQGTTSFTLNITDNDSIAPTLDLKPVTNLEGCNAVFVAQLTLPTKNAVSFDYSTTDGTAISPGDFTQMSGTVTIPPGRKEIGISIPLIADGSPDSGETFTMTITNVQNATLGTNTALATIKEASDISASNRIQNLPSYTDISSFQLSPDGCFIVANMDVAMDNSYDIFSMDVFGTGLLRLNPEPRDIGYYIFGKLLISPDSSSIVFDGKYDENSDYSLYKVKPDGQNLTQINPVDTTAYSDFNLSPNGQQIIYRAAQVGSDTYELFTVNIDGTNIQLMNDPFVNGGCVASTGIYSSDSIHVVYTADHGTVGENELYVSRSDGTGSPLKLSPGLPSGAKVDSFLLTPDSQKVVYIADQDTLGSRELYTVNLDGTNLLKLNEALPPAYQVEQMVISPDSSKVAYYQSEYGQGGDIYAVKIDGSDPAVKLITLYTYGYFGNFQFLPDSSKLVSCGDITTSFADQVYVQALDGTSNVKISGTSGSGFGTDCYRMTITSNSQKVIFVTDTSSTSGSSELYVNNIGGTSLLRLSDSSYKNAFPAYVLYSFSPDETKVIISEITPGSTGSYLRKINIDGTSATNLSSTTANAKNFLVDWPHSRLVYTSNELSGAQQDIFVRAVP